MTAQAIGRGERDLSPFNVDNFIWEVPSIRVELPSERIAEAPEKPADESRTESDARIERNGPYLPGPKQLLRFWLAGPLTLLLFVPALGAGLFGAPFMLPGIYFAYRMLRAGKDDYHTFAWAGFQIGVASMVLFLPFGGGVLYAFGLLFGPLMAMAFRWIAGSWRAREELPFDFASPA